MKIYGIEDKNRLVDALKSTDLTAYELGKRIGISRQAIAHYLDGSGLPTNASCAKIEQFLGKPVEVEATFDERKEFLRIIQRKDEHISDLIAVIKRYETLCKG